MGTTCDCGIAIAVDDSGCTVKQSYQAASVGCTANRSWEDTYIIDAAGTCGFTGDSTYIITFADVDFLERDIANDSAISRRKQGLAQIVYLMKIAIERSRKSS